MLYQGLDIDYKCCSSDVIVQSPVFKGSVSLDLNKVFYVIIGDNNLSFDRSCICKQSLGSEIFILYVKMDVCAEFAYALFDFSSCIFV